MTAFTAGKCPISHLLSALRPFVDLAAELQFAVFILRLWQEVCELIQVLRHLDCLEERIIQLVAIEGFSQGGVHVVEICAHQLGGKDLLT